MSICSITPHELEKIERELCKRLCFGATYFGAPEFSQLRTKIYQLKKFTTDSEDHPLDTVVCFEASDPKDLEAKWYVHLGVQLVQRGGGKSATYTMAIGSKADDFHNIAETFCRVHMDYQFVKSPKGELKPERHAQFGGSMPEALEGFGYKAGWLKVDKPRMPNYPICFVLMLHWAFLEFAHCEHIAKILQERWWTNLVRDAEDMTIKEYFTNALNFFNLTANSGKSFLSSGYH